MFNLRKMISYIINIIIAIVVLTIWGEILISFKIDKYIALIISIPLIIALTFISQNVSKKSIGYKISKKLIKDEKEK